MLAPIVVLSPHLDDAVFGVWHILEGRDDVEVITVFSGIPDPGFVTPLDRAHGAEESAEWVRRRRAEDRAALHRAFGDKGAVRHLDLLDLQYFGLLDPKLRALLAKTTDGFVSKVSGQVDLDERVAQIGEALPLQSLLGCTVYAPVGIGGHPDHQAVARYAVALARAGISVRLWADTPYFQRFGLPSWLGSERNLRADDMTAQGLASTIPSGAETKIQIQRLTDEQVSRKVAATREYQTEYAAIATDFGSAMTPEMLAHEVIWSLDTFEIG